MLMRSGTRSPGVRFRSHFLMLLPMLVILSTHLCAQDIDADDDEDGAPPGNFATLTLKYDARGTAEATFFAYGETQDWKVIESQLEEALHCPAGSLVNPSPNQKLPKYILSRSAKEQERYREYAERTRKNTLQGNCPAAMARTGLLFSTDIQLKALTAVLKQAGFARLSIYLSYPTSKFSEHTPGIKVPWETGSSDAPGRVVYRPLVRANYSLDIAAPSLSQIHLAYGLRNRDIFRAAIVPAVFLIAPILVCLWMSRAALRDAEADAIAAWFSYYRVLAWCGNGLVLIWMLGQTVRQGLEVIASYYTSAHTAGAVVLQVGILMLPPWMTFFICILLSYPVYRQLREESWTRREFFINQFLGVAVQFLPLAFFFAAIGMIAVNGKASVALFAGVYVSYAVCKWLHVKYSGLHIEPLSQGELRDRVFEIAKKAAVEIRQVFIVPAGKSQMANAFASRNRVVMFTDYLLSRMNKREVSAVAAHEIAHIQRRHPAWQMAAFIALMFSSEIMYGILNWIVGSLRHALQVRQAAEGQNGASGLAAVVHFGDRVLAFPELILVLFALALFLYHLYSQHMEYVADAGAVQFTGDPEAMITSLLKLSRLNQTPVQWDRATGALLTHPSTFKRVQHIARVGQLSADRLQQLLIESANPQAENRTRESWNAGEQFEIKKAADSVVTLRSVSGELAIKKWMLRLAVIGPAAAICWVVAHYHIQHKGQIFALGGLLCAGIYVALGESQAMWFRGRLKANFMTRLAGEGIEVRKGEMRMVTLSPHGSPRSYALGFSWDTGGLFLGRERLCYIGDQIRFGLSREQIVDVRLGQGVPDWIGEPRTYIEWRIEPGTPVQFWNLVPKDPFTMLGNRRQCIELAAELKRWKSRAVEYPELPDVLESLPAPVLREITNRKLKSAVSFGRFLKVALLSQVLVLVVWIVLGLPSVWFACCLELFANVYSFSPFWFYRESDELSSDVREELGTQIG